MKAAVIARVKSDLGRYLRNRKLLLSPQFSEVIADINNFTSAVVRDGFKSAVDRLSASIHVAPDRPFIEVAGAIVEHHVRFVEGLEREVVRKSLLEAYIHAAGPQHVFAPVGKTRLVPSLRESGRRKFAATVFSMHVFNLICMAIQDELRKAVADVRRFESFMLDVEAVCRHCVRAAMPAEQPALDPQWAQSVARHIEAQLLAA